MLVHGIIPREEEYEEEKKCGTTKIQNWISTFQYPKKTVAMENIVSPQWNYIPK